MDFKMTSYRTKVTAFSLIEFMVAVALTAILATFTLSNFNEFIVNMRVDNEISALNRLLLITRNSAINNRQNATLCPLNNLNECTINWDQTLSVFIDSNNNKHLDSELGEHIIKIKESITFEDKLVYGKGRTSIIYKPTGQLSGLSNGTFRYCPKDYPMKARGIIIARSGRLYQSQDYNHDGYDENRSHKKITCQ